MSEEAVASTPTSEPAGETVTPASEQAVAQESSSWYPEDAHDYMQAKGWDKPDSASQVLNSYRELERTFKTTTGEPNRVLLMPKDPDNQEEFANFWGKLGRPDSVEGYEQEITEGDTLLPRILDKAHQLGVPKSQLNGLLDEFRAWGQETNEAQEAEAAQQREIERNTALDNWNKEQGSALNESLGKIKQAEQMFPELTTDVADAIGWDKYMNLMTSLGSRLGEHGSVDGEDTNANLTVGSAKAAIMEMMADTNAMTAMQDEGHPAHQATKMKWEKLHQQAYPS